MTIGELNKQIEEHFHLTGKRFNQELQSFCNRIESIKSVVEVFIEVEQNEEIKKSIDSTLKRLTHVNKFEHFFISPSLQFIEECFNDIAEESQTEAAKKSMDKLEKNTASIKEKLEENLQYIEYYFTTQKEIERLKLETLKQEQENTKLKQEIEKQKEKKSYPMLQGKGLNQLIKTKQVIPEGISKDLEYAEVKMMLAETNRNISINIMGETVIEIDSNFKLIFKDYEKFKKKITTTAHMLLDCLIIVFTKTNNISIRLPIKEYMEMRGLKDEKSAREQVTNDLEVLKLIGFETSEKLKNKWINTGSIYLYGGTGFLKDGTIHFSFNVDFYSLLKSYKVMDYSDETLKINPKLNPNSYYFSRYIDENYRMNEGKDRVNIISIKTLMATSPELPTYEEIMATDKKIKQRIIEPFIRDLDAISRLYYDFIDENNNIIIDLELKKIKYDDFIKLRIRVDYSDYVKHEERLEKRKVHLEEKPLKKVKKKVD